MKKILALTLCSALALSVFSTGFKLNDNTEREPVGDHAVIITDNDKPVDYSKDPLAAKGLDVIAKMGMLAGSTEYLEAASANEDFSAILSEIASGDYSTPTAVYKIALPEGTASEAVGVIIEDFDEEIKSLVDDRFLSAIPSQINGQEGVNTLAALTLTSVGTAAAVEGVEDNQLYLFTYDNGYSAIVIFMPQEENVVSISASFVKSDALSNLASVDKLNDLVKENFNAELDLEFELVK